LPTLDVSTLRAAIFDFDETMIDLEAQHHAATRALCLSMGSDYETLPESFRLSSGMRILDEIETMRNTFGWIESLEALAERRTQLMLEELRNGELRWLPGVEEVVRALRERGLRLAIASSGTREYIEETLLRLGLHDEFEVVIAGEAVTSAKPHPEAYLVAAEALRLEPSRCCAFEDSSVGVQAAKAAGMFCIGVRNRAAHIAQDLTPADLVVESLTDLRIA
jgi:HAD superfamily hydrolase (TIGR01509 family)